MHCENCNKDVETETITQQVGQIIKTIIRCIHCRRKLKEFGEYKTTELNYETSNFGS